jgi:hypothetical protein
MDKGLKIVNEDIFGGKSEDSNIQPLFKKTMNFVFFGEGKKKMCLEICC